MRHCLCMKLRMVWILIVILSLVVGKAWSQEPDSFPAEATSASNTIVIGIHGLLNKPAEEQLKEWWKQAIQEGLQRNHNLTPSFSFDMAYWADVRNPCPIALDALNEPYVLAQGSGPLPRFDQDDASKFRDSVNKAGGWLADKEKDLFGLGTHVEKLIGISFEDLDEYYQKQETREAIRDRLSVMLRKYSGKNIILIAHSMGSIVAYDVLRMEEDSQNIRVQTFLTIGSPLGLPIVGEKIIDEFHDRRTPKNVERWVNLADPGDKVALDIHLADEYQPNDAGVQVKDVLVHNGYRSPKGEKNENKHKSYGYLRAPEVSDILVDALK
jgi:PGAP1-like protein